MSSLRTAGESVGLRRRMRGRLVRCTNHRTLVPSSTVEEIERPSDVQVPHSVASNARTAVMSSAVQLDSRHDATESWNAVLAHKHAVSVLFSKELMFVSKTHAGGDMGLALGRTGSSRWWGCR